jgi:hypothetical protein
VPEPKGRRLILAWHHYLDYINQKSQSN